MIRAEAQQIERLRYPAAWPNGNTTGRSRQPAGRGRTGTPLGSGVRELREAEAALDTARAGIGKASVPI